MKIFLGWYSEFDERGEKSIGQYGCVYDTPPEYENQYLAPFTGIPLFYGEPQNTMTAFMKITGIEKLHHLVTKNN